MSKYYQKTHELYRIHSSECIGALRAALGDNNIYQPFKKRPWFTNSGCVYIRKDIATPALITYLLLKR